MHKKPHTYAVFCVKIKKWIKKCLIDNVYGDFCALFGRDFNSYGVSSRAFNVRCENNLLFVDIKAELKEFVRNFLIGNATEELPTSTAFNLNGNLRAVEFFAQFFVLNV